MDLSAIRVENFAPLVGTTFESESLALTLTEASPLSAPPHVAGGRQPFRLHFSGPAPLISQGIRCLTSQAGESLEIFLVPIGTTDGGFLYEAIFN